MTTDLGYIKASDGTGEAVRAVVTGARSPEALTLPVDSIVNFPAKFVLTTGTYNEETESLEPEGILVMLAHLDGNTVVVDEMAPGYADVGNTVGQVALIKPATAWADMIHDFLAISHKEDGSLKQINPTEPGLLLSVQTAEPAPDPDGRIILWFEPLEV